MEITSIKYISASPYMSKAQIQKLMNVSARTVTSRIAEIDQYVQNGRYGAHTILDGCGVTYVNYLAFIDFLKYRKDLKLDAECRRTTRSVLRSRSHGGHLPRKISNDKQRGRKKMSNDMIIWSYRLATFAMVEGAVLLWLGMIYGFWMMLVAVIYKELIEYANDDDMDHAIKIYKKSTLGTAIPQVQITNNSVKSIARKGA